MLRTAIIIIDRFSFGYVFRDPRSGILLGENLLHSVSGISYESDGHRDRWLTCAPAQLSFSRFVSFRICMRKECQGFSRRRSKLRNFTFQKWCQTRSSGWLASPSLRPNSIRFINMSYICFAIKKRLVLTNTGQSESCPK